MTSIGVTSRNDSVKPAREGATVSSESITTLPSVNHVGIALCNTQKGHEPLNSMCCVLQTAKVKVGTGKGNSVQVTVLFDTGSDRSYVSSSLVKRVKPTWLKSEPICYSAFGNNSSLSHMSDLYDLRLEDCKGIAHFLVAVEINTMCSLNTFQGTQRQTQGIRIITFS